MKRLPSYALVLALCFGGAATAFAHAELASAVPAAGASVQTAPSEISITFTEEVAARFSGIEVQDAKGNRFDEGAARTPGGDAKLLSVALKPLAPGVYKVSWHATSADDSHKTKGTFEFTFKP